MALNDLDPDIKLSQLCSLFKVIKCNELQFVFFFILLFQTLSLFPAGDNFRLQNVDGAFYLKKKNTSIILQETNLELKNV